MSGPALFWARCWGIPEASPDPERIRDHGGRLMSGACTLAVPTYIPAAVRAWRR